MIKKQAVSAYFFSPDKPAALEDKQWAGERKDEDEF